MLGYFQFGAIMNEITAVNIDTSFYCGHVLIILRNSKWFFQHDSTMFFTVINGKSLRADPQVFFMSSVPDAITIGLVKKK